MSDGTKEVLAVVPGYRESTESWGAVWPESKEQRCWNHKMRNVLDRLPKREQATGRDLLRKIVYAPSRAEAMAARRAFEKRFEPWYPKAVEILTEDWDRLVTFYDFPEQHWKHLRTTNLVESPFASVRLRTTAAKRFKRVDSATTLLGKLLTVTEKRFRKLNAPRLFRQVADGHIFKDGKPVPTAHGRAAA